MGKLIIASGNRGKVAEFKTYLAALEVELLPKPETLEVEETGNTFLENAYLKASQVSLAVGEWALADDSGLEVESLGGAPGVRSARYGHTDQERIARLLAELGSKPPQAQFVCAIAVANPQGRIMAEALGICAGEIISTPRGDRGFGYDPIFWVPAHQQTFGEMAPELKGAISHRALALKQLLPQLLPLFPAKP